MEPNYAEIRDIIKHFKGIPAVSGEALEAYCKRRGFKVMTPNEYEDWLYQRNADARSQAFVQDAMKVISRFRWLPALASQAEKEAILTDNAGIEVDLCDLLEKHDIPYDRYIDNMMQEFATALSSLLRNASTRANNMGAGLLMEIAQESLGSPLTYKGMGREYRRRHPVKHGNVQRKK